MMKNRGGFFCTATSQLEARHYSSGLNSLFNSEQLSFADYVARSRDIISKVRSATDQDALQQSSLHNAIEGNSPFELKPSGTDSLGKEKPWRRGILLTHGLSDSPYFMRHMAAVFQESGFRVMAVLLPGHGTRPGDLLEVTWQEWAKVVAYGTDKLAAEVDEVYLGGYSAGGALSIYQSLQDQRVRGLFLFAPAIDITHRAAFASLHKLVSWLVPCVKWVDIKPDKDIYKYESFAKNTATQMYQLTLALGAELKQYELHIPIFTVASVDDKTVNTAATLEFMAQHQNPANKFILYSNDTNQLSKNLSGGNIEWVNSFIPEQKILSSAHTAILVSPDDEHYGVDGNYANCIHYYPDNMEKYNACMMHPKECWLGEITEKNLEAGVLRRLMYNPNFMGLKKSLSLFISNLPLL
jgi:esterase/lipase